MMNVEAFEIVDHGVEHEHYFTGSGTAFTQYTLCFTGIGEDFKSALEDAVEQAVISGCNFHLSMKDEIQKRIDAGSLNPGQTVDSVGVMKEDHHYYVSLRIREEQEEKSA